MTLADPREFDEWANNYDLCVQARDDFPFRGYAEALRRIVQLADADSSTRVLDIGIGTGNLASHFVDLGCEVWGIDFSAKMLDLAESRFPGIHLAQANLLGPWPVGLCLRFDRLVSGYVFHHFDLTQKVELLVRLARDHCAAGARIVVGDISFPTRADLERTKAEWAELWDEEHYWIADEAIPEFERVGLRVGYEQIGDFAGVFTFEPQTRGS